MSEPVFAELQGQIERVTYTNDESGYTIAKLKTKGHRELVTIVGVIQSASPGEVLRLKGQWVTHPKYGEQFKVHSYESVVPATAVAMERYLGSGLIKGIGPVMAKRIVAAFGADAFTVIDESPDALRQVEGIGARRIEMITKAWDEHKEIKEVMLFLQGHGVSAAYAAKIFRQYGKEAIRIVRDNPYRLAHDIFGIGFLTADRIAAQLGVARDSLGRVHAGIIYVLYQLSEQGHVFYPFDGLIGECKKHLDVMEEDKKVVDIPEVTIAGALATLAVQGKIVIEQADGGVAAPPGKAVYLAKYHTAEKSVADNLTRLLGEPARLRSYDLDKVLAWTRRELGIDPADNQVKAIKESLANKVLVITGGPGTGKTTIIRAIIGIYRTLHQKVLLAAPTGRAAKRMSEATGQEAKTIHRLLEFSPQEGDFRRNEDNPVDADLIVIDETSMVDTVLMHHFLKAVPPAATLILVGDTDQLPSVGPGNVLRDIIDSGVVPTVRLDEIFRQSRESLIVVNAHRVDRGEMPSLNYDPERLQDFYFISVEEPEDILQKVVSLCRDRIPERFGFHPIRDIQVITAMHRGVIGASNLNTELQNALNPCPDEISKMGRTFRRGDKVMQIVNNYEREVFNGDIGVISAIDREDHEVTVEYDGRPVVYGFTDLDEIVLAYATSVHKSQGSEYPAVVMPLHTQHYMLLQRNLLYTAITRGRNLVVIVGTRKALGMAVRNDKPQKRYTRLKERLTGRLAAP